MYNKIINNKNIIIIKNKIKIIYNKDNIKLLKLLKY